MAIRLLISQRWENSNKKSANKKPAKYFYWVLQCQRNHTTLHWMVLLIFWNFDLLQWSWKAMKKYCHPYFSVARRKVWQSFVSCINVLIFFVAKFSFNYLTDYLQHDSKGNVLRIQIPVHSCSPENLRAKNPWSTAETKVAQSWTMQLWKMREKSISRKWHFTFHDSIWKEHTENEDGTSKI